MSDVKKGEGVSLVDPILGRLEGDSLVSEQAKNNNANTVMTAQIAKRMQSHIDTELLEQKREELQKGYTSVQATARSARATDEAVMTRIEAENAAKGTTQPKNGLFGWGFWGL